MAEILTDSELREIQAASRYRDFSFAGSAIDTLITSHRALAAERDELQTERDNLRKRIDSWFGPNSCSVCGGYSLASGRECVCGGKGTMQAEFEGLRQELFNSDERIRTLESACEAALELIKKVRHCHHACTRDSCSGEGKQRMALADKLVEQLEGAIKHG